MANNKRAKLTLKQWLRQNAKNSGVCEQIQKATKKGFEAADLIKAGFNKNTVYRQRREALAA
jgi:hypothetical protein